MYCSHIHMRDRGLRNVTACNYDFQLCDYECNYIVLLCFDYAVIILYCFVVTVTIIVRK